MIVQERVAVCIMLCNLVERRQPKCAAYFPQLGETLRVDASTTVHCRTQKEVRAGRRRRRRRRGERALTDAPARFSWSCRASASWASASR